MIKDVAGVWELPAAILLPALYALIVPIIRIALLQLADPACPGLPPGLQRSHASASPTEPRR